MKRPDYDTEILRFVAHYSFERGYPPTLAEIADAVGLVRSTVHRRLRRLRAAEKVEWVDRAVRTIRVISE